MSGGEPDGGLLARLRTAVERLRADDRNRFNRRLAVLLLVLFLVPLGAGLGTVDFDLGDGGDNSTTAPVDLTPTDDRPQTSTPEASDEGRSSDPDTPVAARASGDDSSTGEQTAGGGDGGAAAGDGGTELGDTGGGTGVADATDDGGTEPAEGGGSVPDEDDGGTGPDDPDGGGTAPGDATDSGVSLRAAGPQLSIRASKLAPGASGRGTVTYRNAGDRTGRFSVANLDVEDSENGIVSAERPVDSSPNTGELSGAVHVEMRIESDGETTHLYGTGSAARPLAALGRAGDGGDAVALAPGETATVVLTWRLPEATGNEIQSDAASFDATISLTAT